MTDNATLSEREEIELLVPWYVTGRIAPADRRRVEDYLARHPEFGASITVAREEQRVTIALNEALGAPRSGSVERLLARIAADSAGADATSLRSKADGLLAQVREFFNAPSAMGVRYAAAAAALVIVAQAATLGVMLATPGGGGNFRTASSRGAASESGPALLVAFQPQATLADIEALLAEAGGRIVEGPLPGGIYKVRLASSETASALATLKAKPALVRSVLPGR
ncbi:MAG: hypothetical protein JNM89_04020 [Hyphomicrobiaceae bacterium]|nr:hypothetical protein [Hyphomicrobiaceae bacterium]